MSVNDEIRIGKTIFYILVPQDNKCGECKRKILTREINEGKTLRRGKQIYCKTCFKADVPKISSYQYKKARKGKIIKKTETKQQPKSVVKVKRLRYVNKTQEIPKPQICIIPDKKLEKSKMPEKAVKEVQTPSTPKVIAKWRNAFKEMTSGKSTITEILHQVKQEEKMFIGETIASLLLDQWLRKEVDIALNAIQFEISVEEKALREVEEISWQDRYKTQKKL